MSHPEMLSILGYIAAIGDEDQVRIIKKWMKNYSTFLVKELYILIFCF